MQQKAPTLREYLHEYQSKLKQPQIPKISIKQPYQSTQSLIQKIAEVKNMLKQKLNAKDYHQVCESLQDIQGLFFLHLHEVCEEDRSEINVRTTVSQMNVSKLKMQRGLKSFKDKVKDDQENVRNQSIQISFDSKKGPKLQDKMYFTNTTDISFINRPALEATDLNKIVLKQQLLELPYLQRKLSYDLDDQSIRSTKKSQKSPYFLTTF